MTVFSTPRGLAVKIIGVEGTRLPGGESDVTQDFVLVNAPGLCCGHTQEVPGQPQDVGCDHRQGRGREEGAVCRGRAGRSRYLRPSGAKSPMVTTMGGHPETNILGETFYSQVPVLYGDYVAKVAVFPIFDLSKLTGAPHRRQRQSECPT